jgi:hypothetical protein
MPQELNNVIVERISLVTNDATPAVPKAETRFALFKALPKWLQKLQAFFATQELKKHEHLMSLLEKNQKDLAK